MSDYIVKLIGSFFGSIGFGLIFHGKRKNILIASGGALIGISGYIFCTDYAHWSVFISALIAGFICDIYSEIMARTLKAPSTVFFLITIIPLIPGSTLYYCIDKIVVQDWELAWQYGIQTFLTALGICVGMSIAWAICDLIRKLPLIAK